MLTRSVLELEEVEAGKDAALAFARQKGWDVTIAIVDASGDPVVLARMDNASPLSVETAIGKARTAALIGLPTKAVEAMVSDRPALLSMNRVSVEGGVPVLFEGQRLGGVGVSGVQSHQDGEVAQAGVDAITRGLTRQS
jgi:glc operon protein GlcG